MYSRPTSLTDFVVPSNITRDIVGTLLFNAPRPAFGVSYNPDFNETHLCNIQPDWASFEGMDNHEVRAYFEAYLAGASVALRHMSDV